MKKLSVGLLALLFIGCGRFANNEDVENISTKKNEEFKPRIVCLSKQYNEVIYALEAQQNLVGVDLSSTYPPEIKKLITVGYHRALSVEGILSTKPSLIIHDNNIGPEHVVTQLEKLKIPMKTFDSYEKSIEGTCLLMQEMGMYFNKTTKADSLCKQLHEDMDLAKKALKNYIDTPKVVLIHFGRASNIYLTVTKNSTAGKMIKWAGGQMAIDGEGSMRQLSSPELIAEANPDVILITDFGYDRLGTLEEVNELPGVSETKAAKSGRVYRVEEHDLIYMGPRTGKNVLKLQELIHKEKYAKE